MPSNNTGKWVFDLADKYGHIGHLHTPGRWSEPRLPYALDNGRFACWSSGREWRERDFWELIEKACSVDLEPLWIVVPDVVADRNATLQSWQKWEPKLRSYGWPLAMAVQDGMTPEDVPPEAEVVFVGGSTEWKWENLSLWTDKFPRVHVGRVNGATGLWRCYHAGVESIDGTGWVRGNRRQQAMLVRFLRVMAGLEYQLPLFPETRGRTSSVDSP